MSDKDARPTMAVTLPLTDDDIDLLAGALFREWQGDDPDCNTPLTASGQPDWDSLREEDRGIYENAVIAMFNALARSRTSAQVMSDSTHPDKRKCDRCGHGFGDHVPVKHDAKGAKSSIWICPTAFFCHTLTSDER